MIFPTNHAEVAEGHRKYDTFSILENDYKCTYSPKVITTNSVDFGAFGAFRVEIIFSTSHSFLYLTMVIKSRSENEVVMKTIAVGNFKTHCLLLLDQVAQSRKSIVITKYGKPVAKIFLTMLKRISK